MNITEGLKKGDNEAWNEFVTDTRTELRQSINRLGVLGEDADDVMQDSYLNLFLHRDRLNFDGNITGYLNVIGRNRARDYGRAYRRTPFIGNDEVLARVPDTTDLEQEVLGEILFSEMTTIFEETLSPSVSEVVLLSLTGMTHQEMAESLDRPLGTVKSHQRRVRMALQPLMEEYR
jgi:RNA polymerase sigma-70 factor (ECF subfamily)